MSFGDGRGAGAQHGMTGHGIGRALRGSDKKPPDLIDPTRQRDLPRILALFRPYRLRLAAVLVLIVISAAVGILNPFLIRNAIDIGLVGHDSTALTLYVLAMLAIAMFSNAASVWQTYMSNLGRPAGDARPARRRLPPPPADVAGVLHRAPAPARCSRGSQTTSADSTACVTTTATTIAQNATTVIAALVAMLLLDWRLALLSLVFVPPSVY